MLPDILITKSTYAEVVLPIFGQTKIFEYTIDNGFMSVKIINYGATIIAINVPNSDGVKENVILDYDDIVGYLNTKNPYIGATIGRYGHRIGGAAFNMKDQTYYLSRNDGNHTYHGGVQGFDKKIWSHKIEDSTVLMTYRSYDLEEGFPGDLCVTARFILTNLNQLVVIYRAIPANSTTPVNIMNQLYFNLSGDTTNNVFQHQIKIYSEFKAVVLDEEQLPTGETEEVEGTPFDVRKYTPISKILESTGRESSISIAKNVQDEKPESLQGPEAKDTATSPDVRIETNSVGQRKGVYYCIEGIGVRPHAKLKHERSGRAVQIFSDQPCIYFSTGNELVESPNSKGKWGCNAGILLQTGNFPDAVHQEKFPSPWIHAKKTYQHSILYKFRVSKLDCSDEEDGLPKAPELDEDDTKAKCFTVRKENVVKSDLKEESKPPS